MNLKKFIEKFTSAPVNEKKVAEIVKVYGVELPEDVQHFVSACGKNPLFIEDDQVDADFRVLSFDEIVDAEEDLDTDFKSMNMMPLIDFYDNQFVVYKFDEQCWAMYSFDDDSTSDEYPSLNDFLLNFYDLAQSEDCDVEQGDNDAVEALARLGKTGNAEEVPVNETPAQNEEVEKLPSVCFTGACPGYTRAELSDLVEGKYVVKDSVTKDLDILVCADPNSGSSKLQKAAKNGVRIMSYDDFLAIIGEDDEDGDEQRQIELTKKVLDDIRKNTMKPLLRLKLTKKPVSLFESKVGGLPYLPNKEAVPFDANGCPLRMVAQIDCKELSYLPDYPQTGLMQFWVGQDEVYGLDIDGGARVVWYETIDETVTDDMVRAWLAELPQPEDDEDFPIQDEFAISFSETQEPMSLLDNNFTDIFTEKYNELSDDEPIDDYDELSEEAHSLIEDFADSDGHKIGGYPAFCQDDPRNENQTVVLLQIDSDSDNDIWWGDSGVCGFFCTPEELKKRDFSKVLYNWDCY